MPTSPPVAPPSALCPQATHIIPTETALIYGRVSTKEQDLATQELGVKGYTALKRFLLVEAFYDKDESRSIPIWKRPAGRRLRARIEAGGIKHLVAAKLDRLGCGAPDVVDLITVLAEHHVILHIVDLGGCTITTQGPIGRFVLCTLAEIAQMELEMIHARIKDKFKAKRSREELCGTVPYGFDAVETGEVQQRGDRTVKIKRLVDNPIEQNWILHMLSLRCPGLDYTAAAAGTLDEWKDFLRQAGLAATKLGAKAGYHSIAKELNRLGVPTKHGAGEIMRLRRACRAVAPSEGGCAPSDLRTEVGRVTPCAPSERRFTTGRWQSGNVHKILNSQTTRDWLARRAQAAAPTPDHDHPVIW